MFSKRAATIFSTAAAATFLFAGSASAHKTDLAHWFEHQRALTDGGTVGLIEPAATIFAAPATVAAFRLPAPQRPLASAGDCLLQQMAVTDGAVTPVVCDARTDERWIVDEDKQRGRPAEQARAK